MKTAVEWLADEIIMLEERLRQEEINLNDFMDFKDDLVTKALEMEKERMIDFASYYTVMTIEEIEIGFNHKFKQQEQ